MKTFVYPLLVASVLVVSCTSENKNSSNSTIQIVTTTGMIRDAVANVVGSEANVVALIGPGVDPHLYKASQGDLEKLSSADIIFYNGLHLEGKMGEVLEKLAAIKPVVPVGEGIPDSLLRTVPGFAGAHDPHIWFDVSLWKHAVESAEEFLSAKYPALSENFKSRGAAYQLKLDSLHASVVTQISQIPEAGRVLVTAHDAFGYFGDAYNIEVKGLQGISTVSEFGLRDITALVNFITTRKIKAVFIESSVSPRSIEAVVEGCRKKGWDVSIGGSLYSDAMGAEGTPEGTYIGMVNANVQTIVKGLR